MEKIMDKQGILTLAKKLINLNPENLHSPDIYLKHLSDTYDIAREVADDIITNYPNLSKHLNKEVVALAGGLHDIGRPLNRNQLFHELRGAEYIRKEGLQEKIAESKLLVDKIAKIIMPHFLVFEEFYDSENQKERQEFKHLKREQLLINTCQQAIIVYADISNFRGERVSFEKGLNDVETRYTEGSIYRVLAKGIPRMRKICRKVEAIREGKLSEEEVLLCGFIWGSSQNPR